MDQQSFLRFFKEFLEDRAQPMGLDLSDESSMSSTTMQDHEQDVVLSEETSACCGSKSSHIEDKESSKDIQGEVNEAFTGQTVPGTNESQGEEEKGNDGDSKVCPILLTLIRRYSN